MAAEHLRSGVSDRGGRVAVSVDPVVQRLRSWLPPVDRWEFWAIQVLVLLIAAIHSWIEYANVLEEHSPAYLLPTTLYLVPVTYAAVTFGRRGAVLTAIWATILVLPNIILFHHDLEVTGEAVQATWIVLVAIFVGSRVDRERTARAEAEFREQRQRDSEERYRAIVNNVGEPILVLDAERRIVEANDAAASLLGSTVAELRGHRPTGHTGDAVVALLEDTADEERLARVKLGQPPRWYAPITMARTDTSGATSIQLLLIDVTSSYEREQGLESITHKTITAREEERRRVSRELHDGPLQSLMAVWRELDSAAAEASEPMRGRLLHTRAATESVADELRRFSRDLRPSVLDDLGIAAALRAEAERITQQDDIEVGVHISGPQRRLGGDTEVTLLRIAQEALRNVIRHADASSISIALEFEPDAVRLRVVDDGVGMAPVPASSELLAGSHLGLLGMQERARMIGGSVRYMPADPHGLQVVVEAPASPL